MKKFFLVLIALSACLFTSCYDYIQGISVIDNQFVFNTRFTFSKALLEQAGTNPEDYLQSELVEKGLETFGCEYDFKLIDNSKDVGYEFAIKIDKDDETPYPFMPYFYDNSLYVPFMFVENGIDMNELLKQAEDETSVIAAMGVLNECKMRILVSKDIMPVVTGACFESIDGSTIYNIPFYDYGESYGIEVPLSVTLLGSVYKLDNLIVY